MDVGQVLAVVALGALVIFALGMGTWPLWGHLEKARAARRSRASTSGAGMMGVVDEIFRPATHTANLVWEAQQELPAPAPDSDDQWRQLDAGRIRITVADDQPTQAPAPRSTT